MEDCSLVVEQTFCYWTLHVVVATQYLKKLVVNTGISLEVDELEVVFRDQQQKVLRKQIALPYGCISVEQRAATHLVFEPAKPKVHQVLYIFSNLNLDNYAFSTLLHFDDQPFVGEIKIDVVRG